MLAIATGTQTVTMKSQRLRSSETRFGSGGAHHWSGTSSPFERVGSSLISVMIGVVSDMMGKSPSPSPGDHASILAITPLFHSRAFERSLLRVILGADGQNPDHREDREGKHEDRQY